MKIFSHLNNYKKINLTSYPVIFLCLLVITLLWIIISGNTGQKNQLKLTEHEQNWLKKNAKKVTFAPTPYYPPLDFIDRKGNHQGLGGDLLRLLEQKIGYRFKRKEYDSWSQIEQAARKKEIDGVPLVHKTDKRKNYWAFTKSYIEIPTVIIGRDHSEPASSLEEFKGKELAIVEDYALIDTLRREHSELNLKEISGDLEGLQRLSLGEFDGVIIDFPVASQLIEEAEIPNLQILTRTEYSYDYRLAVRRDWPVLAQILDKALADISEDKMDKLKNKWIPGLTVHEDHISWKIVLGILSLFILALIFFIFWVWLLRRTVEKRTAQLKESKRRLSTLIDNILGGIVYRCENKAHWPMKIIRGDCQEITGYPPDKIKNGEVSWELDIIHPEDRQRIQQQVQEALQKQTQFSITYRIKTRNEEIKWVTDRGQGVHVEEGNLEAIEGLITDITHQKEIEEQLSKSLDEKETLLHEIHHRVKNNLFTIISFLSLQKNKYSGQMSECLQDAINRVQAMALIHKEIYENSNLSRLNFASLIKKISNNLIETYRRPDQEINVQFELDRLKLTPEQAIPCSLAATELISNSIYHGIGEQKEGKLKISLKKLSPKKVKLTITDNGSGLPEDFELNKNASLGLTIARKLVNNQLQGELKINSSREGKTSSYIVFSHTQTASERESKS